MMGSVSASSGSAVLGGGRGMLGFDGSVVVVKVDMACYMNQKVNQPSVCKRINCLQ